MWRWCATYLWKNLDKCYNFISNLTSIEGVHTKLWASKSRESQLWAFWDSHLGVLRQNDIWVLILCGQAHSIIQGGRWWLPPTLSCDESYESMFVCASSMHQKCSSYALTNLLFGLCKFMWIIDFLINLHSPNPEAPAQPFTPMCCELRNTPLYLEVLQAREHNPLPRNATS